jgi:hypothetical protein
VSVFHTVHLSRTQKLIVIYRKGLADKILLDKRKEKENKRLKGRRRYACLINIRTSEPNRSNFDITCSDHRVPHLAPAPAPAPTLHLGLEVIQIAVREAIQIVLQGHHGRANPVHQAPVLIIVLVLVAPTPVRHQPILIHPHLDHRPEKDVVKRCD